MGGGNNGSFPSENLVLAVWYSGWKSPGRATSPVQCGGVLGPPTTGEMEAEHTDGGQDSRRGPRQQQGGAKRSYRLDTSDPTAQQHPRPCGLGEQGGAWNEMDTPAPWEMQTAVAEWSEVVAGKPEAASV